LHLAGLFLCKPCFAELRLCLPLHNNYQHEQYESYKRADYNETLTRRDFIDPFFKALGWDIDNRNGYAETYREVIHEDRVKVGKATKAPDYSFRLSGGKRLFFVEAKKPSVAVKEEIQPAYQVRRYGWSAKLAVSIITDFEELAVYDCTKKPNPTDKASVARVKYLTYKDYLKEFDFLWDTFSKERVLKGSFDKFIQSNLHKKGTATVDKEFLLSLDSWRTYLATSIAINNKHLDEDEINFAVQQTIDRIIFLRIAEDRSVEPYGALKEAIKSGNYYQNLFHLFQQADDKYNSGLFDFKKDKISKALTIDNKVVKTILNELYYPESPYEFSVLSVEILGSAYEQFLGKTITIDKAHRAKIEEKPEVRKAGGVYYTPQYVVDYIVQNTVGKLVENKAPKEVAKIKIVDPACGSGSFLIGAYQYLLDWHLSYYNTHKEAAKKDKALTPTGALTTGIKKQILLNNIYGVDIDVNAVEVTKLSLLLKCMEGETSASISHQFQMFNERVLPTLDNNIKSGNSLVDTDFYDNQLDFGEEKKIKPFNWQKAFPEVCKLTIPKRNS
jgi:adenine-specific DNA-methyltransferase